MTSSISSFSETLVSKQEQITTSAIDRAKKVCALLFRTVFSCCSNRREWSRFLTAKKEKKYFVVTQVTPKSSEAIQKKEVHAVQSGLDARGIPLNCAQPARQVQRNDLLHDNIKTYLSYLNTHGPQFGFFEVSHGYMEALFKRGIKKITIEELERNLAACATYVHSQLTKPYDIGFRLQKSSKWIAELALAYFSRLPETYFYHAVDSDSEVPVSPLTSRSTNYVIFDDCSYSGHQLRAVIVEMGKELARQNKKGKLFLVVPFVSQDAVQDIKYGMNELQRINSKLKVHLITSNQRIKMIRDFDPSCLNNNSITFTEWKIPDAFTLDCRVSHAQIQGQKVSFLTNFPPCYKM